MIAPWALRAPRRLPPVPFEKTAAAVVHGIPGARYFVLENLEPMLQDVVAARQREQEILAKSGHTGPMPPVDLLAVSGGGDKGAFGAGLLCGWTAKGTRPVFKAVTGVSTGALIAPFAFLGPDYDPVLKQVYTSVQPADIARHRWVTAAYINDGMADNAPLWGLI